MPEALLNIPPGVFHTSARKINASNWREANLVRWEDVTMLPVGGWITKDYAFDAFDSRVRKIHIWQDNAGNTYTAFLCEEHCYVDDGTGTLLDITPVDGFEPVPSIGEGGYGDGPYGDDAYGTPRDSAYARFQVRPHCFTIDNWGQELRVMTSIDGRYLGWDPTVDETVLEAVANAPSGYTFTITPERHVIIFGAGGDQDRWEWSDEEDDTNWTVDVDSKAGGYNVEPRAPIIAAKKTSYGTVFFTSREAYLVEHIGLPYVYRPVPLGEFPAPYSPAALMEVPEGLLWASLNGYWLYNGSSIAPVSCEIWDWITNQINFDVARYESTMIEVPTYFEVWFFFPSEGQFENDRVAIYNYKNKLWTMGKCGRTCGFSMPNLPSPLMSDGYYVFSHESGFYYPGAPEMPWVETFTINTANGAQMTTLHQMLPEVTGNYDAIQYKVYKNNNPTRDSDETVSSPKTIRDNGYVDVRETARQMRLRIEMVANKSWVHGPIVVDVKGRGKK